MRSDGTRVVTPAAELDMGSAATLGSQVLDCLADGVRHVVIDMADVRLIDSAAIGVLLSAQRLARSSGRDLVVANPSTHLRRVFALTGVERKLNVLA
jgi:anti-sigma B factor antagonist